MKTDSLRYAGLWPRLVAMVMDCIILLPLIGIVLWGTSLTGCFRFIISPGTLIGLFYQQLYLVGVLAARRANCVMGFASEH